MLDGPIISEDLVRNYLENNSSSTTLPKPERFKFEVADIFREFGEEYLKNHKLTERQYKAFWDIQNCRTRLMGFHVDKCNHCGYQDISYNSCRNRNCPKCLSNKQVKWVQSRMYDLLPTSYYHVVFTLPNQIFNIAIYNQKIVYDLLFDCSAATLKQFSTNPKWWELSDEDPDPEKVNVNLGFFSVLHTWGQTLSFHPHIHIVTTGGGINDGGQWVWPKYKKKFLFPVKAMAKVFRGKFIEGLKKAYYAEKLELPGRLAEYKDSKSFENWINYLVNRDWVAYCKKPFEGPQQVIEYVGRYTHRVAISNHRIKNIENGKVTFSYKDYRKGGQWDEMVLTGEEFITRFLHHVLPKRFHRLRHYGFLSNGNIVGARTAWEALVMEEELPNDENEIAADWYMIETTRPNCPSCKRGEMVTVLIVDKRGKITKGQRQFFNSVFRFKERAVDT